MRARKKTWIPVLLLGSAVVLLLFSAVGSARAALTYYSENYAMEVTVSSIGVTLTENGKDVSFRNYIEDDWSDSGDGELLLDLLKETDGKLVPGRAYAEQIGVKNSGAIDSYVRVILYRSWQDADGNKDTSLSPDLIDLEFCTDNGWMIDEESSTDERTILYYNKVLETGATSPSFAERLKIDQSVMNKVTQTTVKTDKGTKTITTFDYDGAQFCVEAVVDAVQEHNAADAIWSAWGRRVTVSDGMLSL